MSEQIVLAEYSGDVVLVDGLCYEFAGYTAQPPEELEVTALFDTCLECAEGESSSSPSATIRCTDCDPQIADTFTISLGNLVTPWDPWNGSHTINWKAPHPNGFGAANECKWQVAAMPAGAAARANLKLVWSTVSNKWLVTCHAYTGSFIVWEGPTDPCYPTGSYGTHAECRTGGVVDFPPCDTQGATTCTVS